MGNFQGDMKIGEMAEEYCIEYLEDRYGTLKKREGSFKYYDLYNDNIKLEVKFDKESIHTGRIAIETGYNELESGIMDTQADRWIEIFGFYGIWYLADIPVPILRAYISEAKKIKGGDKDKSMLVLLDTGDFIKDFNDYIECL